MTDPTQRKKQVRAAAWAFIVFTAGAALSACGTTKPAAEGTPAAATAELQAKQESSAAEVTEGQSVFRFDTFGDEQLWTGKLRLNEVVEKNVDPTTALKVGLKVDADALPAGILEKEDGWPNRDLNVGAIIALSPVLAADKKAVYQSWGPGKYDPRYNQDGKNTPLVLPPAYGLAQVKNETYTAEGPISYWNAYVAVTQMGGQGNFSDPRLGIDVKHSPDMVSPKLPALRAYQHSLPAPPPPAGSFDAAIAEPGRTVFDRTCASCHISGAGIDNNSGTLHAPADTGVDGAYAVRTANKAYRTTPLRALWQHPPYFHDGSAATLADVVAHYNRVRKLSLTAEQQRDLVEYLKSL